MIIFEVKNMQESRGITRDYRKRLAAEDIRIPLDADDTTDLTIENVDGVIIITHFNGQWREVIASVKMEES